MTSELVAPPDVYDREQRPFNRSSSYLRLDNSSDIYEQELDDRVTYREMRRRKFNDKGNSEQKRALSLLRGITFEDKWACNFWKTITEKKKKKYIIDSNINSTVDKMNFIAANASLNLAKAINAKAAEKVANAKTRLEEANANQEDYRMADVAQAMEEANAAACEVAAAEAVLEAANAALEAAETDAVSASAVNASVNAADAEKEMAENEAATAAATTLRTSGGRRRTRSIFTYSKRRKNRYNTYKNKKKRTKRRRY